ncbi:DUF4864 domain-containing protein [Pelagibius litoralis]|uniref:DUF4864 domain-containing protein n=1 Tax=Pelagibius litoralis TaxID=374515 RepID=A0A967KHG8_9PROT|nr:DUF4864 domain-containing protein [Pelagibius litoralis]NIA71266.1 DUF4864 domain-containing protein [Pelagibius litoralis]
MLFAFISRFHANLGFIFTVVFISLALGGGAPPVWAQASSPQESGQPVPADRQAILRTIQSQLDAFQADDGARAFSFATPRLREMFGTPDNFMAMVRGGYMSVYRPQSVEFLDARVVSGRTGQAVRFVGPDGNAVIAIYTMEMQPDGSWRIAAVQLVPTGEISS